MHRMKGIKSFQPPWEVDFPNFFGSHGPIWLILSWKKRVQKKAQKFALCFRGDLFNQNILKSGLERFQSTVKSPLRSFCVAIMQKLCQCLIVCSRPGLRLGHAPLLFAVAGPAARCLGGTVDVFRQGMWYHRLSHSLERRFPRSRLSAPSGSIVGVTKVCTFLRVRGRRAS